MLLFSLGPVAQLSSTGSVNRNIVLVSSNFVSTGRQVKPQTSVSTARTGWHQGNQLLRIPVGASSVEDSVPNPPKEKNVEKNPERYKGTIGEFGRFARIVATALLVFLLLFFVDIIAGLAALTLGSFYAIAVLFGVRGVETWGSKIRDSVVHVVQTAAHKIKSAYRTVRREVRRRLEDDMD